MHSIKANFDIILSVLWEVAGDEITQAGNFVRPGPIPRFSDIEVIALSLTAEALSIDSENLLFYKLRAEYLEAIPNLISRRQYNDRRKQLFYWQEKLRSGMANKINAITDKFAIDSMPLEICKLARADRNKMGKEIFHYAKKYSNKQDNAL